MSAQCIVGVSYFRIINYKKLKRECLRNYCVRSGENLGFQFDKVSICLQKSIKKNIVSIFAKSNARHDCHALYRRTSFRWHVLLFVSLTSFLQVYLVARTTKKVYVLTRFLTISPACLLVCTTNKFPLTLTKFLDEFSCSCARLTSFMFANLLVKFSLSALHTNKFQFLLESWHD